MTVRVVTGLIEDLRAEALTLISLLEPLPLLSWSVDTPSYRLDGSRSSRASGAL